MPASATITNRMGRYNGVSPVRGRPVTTIKVVLVGVSGSPGELNIAMFSIKGTLILGLTVVVIDSVCCLPGAKEGIRQVTS